MFLYLMIEALHQESSLHVAMKQSRAMGDSQADREKLMASEVLSSMKAAGSDDAVKTAAWKWEGAVARARGASSASK